MALPLIPLVVKLLGDGIAGTLASGAVYGAGAGAAKTAISGGNLGENMLKGAGGGAAGMGLGSLVGGALGGAGGAAGEAAATGVTEAAGAAVPTMMEAGVGVGADAGATGAGGIFGSASPEMTGQAMAQFAPVAEPAAAAVVEPTAWQSALDSTITGQQVGSGLQFMQPTPEVTTPGPPPWMQDPNFDVMSLFPQQKQKGWWM